MTTNLGTRDISKGVRTSASPAPSDTKSVYERMKNKVNDELKQHFRPEFLNRVDDIVVFHQLTQDEIVTDRRPDGRPSSTSGCKRQGHGHRAHPCGQGPARRAGLRPGPRCAAAAPHDPARDRGRAVREDPLRRARAGLRSSWSTSRARAPSAPSPSAARPSPRSRPIDEIVEAVGAGGPEEPPADPGRRPPRLIARAQHHSTNRRRGRPPPGAALRRFVGPCAMKSPTGHRRLRLLVQRGPTCPPATMGEALAR